MRRKNGFVLAETLIVVLLLTITLMTLYTTFSAIVMKTRSRTNNDTIDTIYKTSFVKDLLDNNYLSAPSDITYTDSFSYYVSNNTEMCRAYGYDGRLSSFLNNGEQILVCDYNRYLNNELKIDSDPLYEPVKAYNIEKIYLLNFGKMSSKDAYKVLDASTIDYSMGKANKLVGDYMIIKYRKNYVYPQDYEKIDNFTPNYDIYHSSIRLNTVKRDIDAEPILLYEDKDTTEQPIQTHLLADSDKYQLQSNHTFNNHGGQVIIGWVNKNGKDLYGEYDSFNKCINQRSELIKNEIYCGKVGEVLEVKPYTRELYAVWCGDKTIEGAIECQIEANTSETDGAFRNESDNNVVYRGTGGDNFVRLGDYCYSMVSEFGKNGEGNKSIKTLFYGAYDKVKKECNNKTNILPEASSSFNTGFDYLSYAWMYKKTGASYGLGNAEGIKTNTGLMQILIEPVKETTPCPYNSYCYFGSKISYDKNTHKYTLLNDDNTPVTEQYNFASFEASNYASLKESKFTKKYVCPGGQTTTCDNAVYYYIGITGSGTTSSTKYYLFKDGLTNTNIGSKKLIASKDATYANGKYTLKTDNPEDYTTFTINEYGYPSTQLSDRLRTYKYMCYGDLLVHDDNSKYTCEYLLYTLNRVSSGTVIALTNGMKTQTDYNRSLIGQPSERKESSDIKKKIDAFYEANIGEKYERFLDMDATFCNDLTETKNNDLNNLPSENEKRKITNYFITSTNYQDLLGKYDSCTAEYLYSAENASVGNKLMKHPIGLLTGQEFTYVSDLKIEVSANSYLAGTYYLMNPSHMETSGSQLVTYGFYVNGTKISTANGNSATNNRIIRPVIAIKEDSIISSGVGSYNNPFVLGE